jgi:hypothetical protein
MRFVVLLAIGAAATSALSVAGIRIMVPPTGQTFRSAPALSGDPSSVKPGDQPDDLNSISAAYDSVMRQIASRRGVDAAEPPPQVVTIGPSSVGAYGPARYFDSEPVQRTWGWDFHRRVHHETPPAREFVHHEPPARQFVHHDAPPAREFHPVAHQSGGGASHSGGHGRR